MMILYKYILKETIIQFLSTLLVFCSVIVISQLVRLSEVLVAFGLTIENIFLPFLYIIVPFLPIIIPISLMFAVMITFTRLSDDGEFTAILASGMPLKLFVLPLLILVVGIYILTSLCSMHLEAWGRREFVQFIYRKTQMEVDNVVRFKIKSGVFLSDFLGYMLYTEEVSESRTDYKNVILAPGRHKSEGDFVLFAPNAQIMGAVESGDLKMSFTNGVSYTRTEGKKSSVLNFEKANIDLIRVFQGRILGEDSKSDDYRSYTADQLEKFITWIKENPQLEDHRTYLKAQYLYTSRYANSLLVFAFFLFGVLLGIQEQRHGKGSGYSGAIATVIGSFVVVVIFRWLAEQGHLPVLFAAFFPPLFLIGLSSFLFYQRNRLPPSESVWNWKHWPF